MNRNSFKMDIEETDESSQRIEKVSKLIDKFSPLKTRKKFLFFLA